MKKQNETQNLINKNKKSLLYLDIHSYVLSEQIKNKKVFFCWPRICFSQELKSEFAVYEKLVTFIRKLHRFLFEKCRVRLFKFCICLVELSFSMQFQSSIEKIIPPPQDEWSFPHLDIPWF
jgi:hypothetical protein